MKRGIFFTMMLVLFISLFLSSSWALEKVGLATAVRMPSGYLPILAAQEKGLFSQQGLQVEWVPFQASTPMYQAVVAGSISLGFTRLPSLIQAVSRGIPLMVVAQLSAREGFSLWVRGDGGLKTPNDLKGRVFGVSRFWDSQHALARAVLKKLGIDKDVRFVATGAIPSSIAMLRTGSVDTILLAMPAMVDLQLRGEAKELTSVDDYLPKRWIAQVMFAQREYARSHPALVRGMVQAIEQSSFIVRAESAWAMQKMKTMSGYSDEAVLILYKDLTSLLLPQLKVDKEALENVLRFLIEYRILAREKAPKAEELYSEEFAR